MIFWFFNMGRKKTGRIKQCIEVSLSPETHSILATKPNKSKAIDEAVINYFTPIATNGKFHERSN